MIRHCGSALWAKSMPTSRATPRGAAEVAKEPGTGSPSQRPRYADFLILRKRDKNSCVKARSVPSHYIALQWAPSHLGTSRSARVEPTTSTVADSAHCAARRSRARRSSLVEEAIAVESIAKFSWLQSVENTQNAEIISAEAGRKIHLTATPLESVRSFYRYRSPTSPANRLGSPSQTIRPCSRT
jgi:hypothetical protein